MNNFGEQKTNSQTLIFLKIGGSLLTDKSKPYTLRNGILEKIAGQIAKFKTEFSESNLIIINGNGSFGHTVAKKYNLHNGFSNEEGKLGFCLLQKETAKMNRLVVDSLIDLQIPAVSFSPATTFWKNSENYQISDLQVLELYLQKKFVPVLHGEVIIDENQNSCTISSDKIPQMLVNYFKNKYQFKLINAGSYDGVMDNQGKTVVEITNQNYEQIKNFLYETKNTDVSGGMQKKIEEFLNLAKTGVTSILINGLIEENIYKGLIGEEILATKIK